MRGGGREVLASAGSITDDDITKAPLLPRVTAAAILEDKARVIGGKATQINVTHLLDAVALAKEMQAQRATEALAKVRERMALERQTVDGKQGQLLGQLFVRKRAAGFGWIACRRWIPASSRNPVQPDRMPSMFPFSLRLSFPDSPCRLSAASGPCLCRKSSSLFSSFLLALGSHLGRSRVAAIVAPFRARRPGRHPCLHRPASADSPLERS